MAETPRESIRKILVKWVVAPWIFELEQISEWSYEWIEKKFTFSFRTTNCEFQLALQETAATGAMLAERKSCTRFWPTTDLRCWSHLLTHWQWSSKVKTENCQESKECFDQKLPLLFRQSIFRKLKQLTEIKFLLLKLLKGKKLINIMMKFSSL